MSQIKNQEILTLEELRAEVIEFKRSHPSATIPEWLWETALQMVGRHGLTQVSQEIGLSFSQLRKRLRQDKGLEPKTPSFKSPSDKVEFVELNLPKKKQKILSGMPRSEMKVRIRTSLGSTFSIQVDAKSTRQWEKVFTGWLRAEQNVRGASL
jgi:hypothetical protein